MPKCTLLHAARKLVHCRIKGAGRELKRKPNKSEKKDSERKKITSYMRGRRVSKITFEHDMDTCCNICATVPHSNAFPTDTLVILHADCTLTHTYTRLPRTNMHIRRVGALVLCTSGNYKSVRVNRNQ